MPTTPQMIMIFALVLTFAMFVCSTLSAATAMQQSESPDDDEVGKSIFILYLVLYRTIVNFIILVRQSSRNCFPVEKISEKNFL